MLQQWWQYRSQRERWMVIIGGIVVIFVLVFELIWTPLEDALTSARAQAANKQVLLQWAAEASREIIALKKAGYSTQAMPSGSILVVVERTLNQASLSTYLRQVQQPQSNQLQLQFTLVPFDKLITWLQLLSKRYAINASQINVSKTNISGVVNMTLTLHQGNVS